MQEVINDLTKTVTDFSNRINEISDKEFAEKPQPDKWSKKEVVGHLIDSAQNNLRRFVCGQYETVPSKITYEQDFWVQANGYQEMDRKDVVELWRLVNTQIANVLRHMPRENYTKQCDTHKTETQLRTLEWLAADYVKHMKHHLNQVLEKSFNVTYP